MRRTLLPIAMLAAFCLVGCSSDSNSKSINNANNANNTSNNTNNANGPVVEFNEVHSSGLTPAAGQCAGSTGGVTLRFVLAADDETPILPGDSIDDQALDLQTGDLTLIDGTLFEYPDVTCQSDDDCRLVGDGFTCTTARSGFSDSQRRCQKSTELSLDGPVEFESDLEKPRLFGVVFENSGSLEGWLPEDVGLRFPDFDDDGTGEGFRDTGPNPSRASDPDQRRFVALTGVRDSLQNVTEFADERDTLFGLWQFSGTSTADVRSLVAQATPQNALWTNDTATLADAQTMFDVPEQTRANVYQALETVIEDGFGSDEFADYEKTLVLFVDGPDDLRLENFSANDVIEKASEQDIRIFIAHLDAALETESTGIPLLRDDFQYWQNQTGPCSNDSDCRNYESCRIPTAYSSNADGAVDISTNDTYCMPERDPNGRTGPIFDYQRIACETGGGYIYIKNSRALQRRMQWLPLTMDGLWKVDGSVAAVENGDVAPGQGYSVQGILEVLAGETTRSFPFAQSGDPPAGREDSAQDTRTILFVE